LGIGGRLPDFFIGNEALHLGIFLFCSYSLDSCLRRNDGHLSPIVILAEEGIQWLLHRLGLNKIKAFQIA
jgi:hypothetical protein